MIYQKVAAYPHTIFDDICEKENWNDSNVESLSDKAFISICCTPDVQKNYLEEEEHHWFKDNHSNVLNLNFDDTPEDTTYNGYNIYTISDEQAKQIVEFVEKNLGKTFFIHCRAGISRSGAICRFIQTNYDEYKTNINDHLRPNITVLRKLNNVLWTKYFENK